MQAVNEALEKMEGVGDAVKTKAEIGPWPSEIA
jgi:hypothetical protein